MYYGLIFFSVTTRYLLHNSRLRIHQDIKVELEWSSDVTVQPDMIWANSSWLSRRIFAMDLAKVDITKCWECLSTSRTIDLDRVGVKFVLSAGRAATTDHACDQPLSVGNNYEDRTFDMIWHGSMHFSCWIT